MKDISMIKSYPHGLTLILNPDKDFETVARDVCEKFASSREFFGTEDIVLSIEGRVLSDEETEAIIQSIEYNSDLTVTLIIDQDETRDRRMVAQLERFYTEGIYNYAKIIYGDVKNGERIESTKSILVIGDVKEDGLVTSTGNIIIWGKHEGTAIAGATGDDKALVVVGDLQTSVIGIGRHSKQIEIENKTGFFKKTVTHPSILKYTGGDIQVQAFSPIELQI
ncbi:MAG: hypothetical protein K6F00_01125 [Lachnospiraceae bacterium]|nr:hypothetical protein [Lachnospiraceae bacterium]